MRIIGIDPGPDVSAFVVWHAPVVVWHAILPNAELLARLRLPVRLPSMATLLAVEMVGAAGIVGKSTFETCYWIGRFIEAWGDTRPHVRILRRTVVADLTGSARGGDAEVRRALIEIVGPQGVRNAPGPTFGLKQHEWAALGVAVTAGRLGGSAQLNGAARVSSANAGLCHDARAGHGSRGTHEGERRT